MGERFSASLSSGESVVSRCWFHNQPCLWPSVCLHWPLALSIPRCEMGHHSISLGQESLKGHRLPFGKTTPFPGPRGSHAYSHLLLRPHLSCHLHKGAFLPTPEARPPVTCSYSILSFLSWLGCHRRSYSCFCDYGFFFFSKFINISFYCIWILSQVRKAVLYSWAMKESTLISTCMVSFSRSYIQISDPFGLDSCVFWEIRVQFDLFPDGNLAAPT